MLSSSYCRPWRWAKTLFFLLSMLLSLLLVCAPLLIAIIDVLLPSAILSAAPYSLTKLNGLDFRSSLLDIPIVSAARSLVIICAYAAFNGRGTYLGITAACSFLSLGYVSVKAAIMMRGRGRPVDGAFVMEGLFLSSVAFAVGHVVVAYKTNCRERRKMIVYRIDLESVSAYQHDFPKYPKLGASK